MVRDICYDTEFLAEKGSAKDDLGTQKISIISIGMVDSGGREYYAVNQNMPVDRVQQHPWLSENVWPHLPLNRFSKDHPMLSLDDPCVKPVKLIAAEVFDFIMRGLHSAHEPRLWAYYSAYDHVALCSLWGNMEDLPDGMPMWTHDLMQYYELLNDSGAAHHDLKPPISKDEHHALVDAKWDMQFLNNLHAAHMKL